MTDLGLHVSDLRQMTECEVRDLMTQLGPEKLEELQYTWRFWARPSQVEPEGDDWSVWLNLAGRGAGKTRSGAEWIREKIKQGYKRVAFIAPTNADIRKTMIEGESGLLNISWKHDKTNRGGKMGMPLWTPTNRQLRYENGAIVDCFSSEDPERLRGPQFEAAWCDELCAWNNMQMTWDMLQFTLRLGKKPRTYISTTPKPSALLKRIMNDPATAMTTGSTMDNASNLHPDYIKTVQRMYEGTRLGRQELYGEVLMEAEGALWNWDLIENCKVEDLPPFEEFKRIVVAVDPAVSSNEISDMTGIIVAGLHVSDIAYVIEDATGKYNPEGWANKAVELYYKYGADRIVAERNQGGEMVRYTLTTADDTVPIRMVHASRGKYARAEPVSALYEQGRVKHVRGLDKLESQMVEWEPLGKIGSPDRLDATVWAITDLILKGVALPELNLVHKK